MRRQVSHQSLSLLRDRRRGINSPLHVSPLSPSPRESTPRSASTTDLSQAMEVTSGIILKQEDREQLPPPTPTDIQGQGQLAHPSLDLVSELPPSSAVTPSQPSPNPWWSEMEYTSYPARVHQEQLNSSSTHMLTQQEVSVQVENPDSIIQESAPWETTVHHSHSTHPHYHYMQQMQHREVDTHHHPPPLVMPSHHHPQGPYTPPIPIPTTNAYEQPVHSPHYYHNQNIGQRQESHPQDHKVDDWESWISSMSPVTTQPTHDSNHLTHPPPELPSHQSYYPHPPPPPMEQGGINPAVLNGVAHQNWEASGLVSQEGNHHHHHTREFNHLYHPSQVKMW